MHMQPAVPMVPAARQGTVALEYNHFFRPDVHRGVGVR